MRWICVVALLGACGDPATDGEVTLGRQQVLGYRIDPATTLTLSKGDFGVTNTGVGRFRLIWTGAKEADVLTGVLTTDGQFDPNGTSPFGGKELVANQADRIEFRVNPSATVNGLDLVTSEGPIYLDLARNAERSSTKIAFMRSGHEQVSTYNPVAIDVR